MNAKTTIIAAFVLATSTGLGAAMASGGGSSPTKEDYESEKARYDADAARYSAQQAAAEARFKFIPQSGAEGKVTLGDKAGATEAAMLASEDLQALAAAIVRESRAPSGTILLTGIQTYTLDNLGVFRVEAASLQERFGEALGSQMPTGCVAQADGANRSAALIGAGLSAVAGMLKTDTEVSGIDLGDMNGLLVRAIGSAGLAASPRTAFVLPDEMRDPGVGKESEVRATLCVLDRARTLGKAMKKPAPALSSAITDYEAFKSSLTKAGENGAVRLAAILKEERLARAPATLRVHADHVGGTLMTRRNLWTALGARSLAISGGAVASYTMVDRAGQITAAGVLSCTTGFMGLTSVGKRKSDCRRSGELVN